MSVRSSPLLLLVVSTLGCSNAAPGGRETDAGPTCVATDEPDSLGLDANCDGVDGVASDSVFVGGANAHDANLGTALSPFATLARALEVAEQTGKHHVLIAQGTYTESIELVDGISLHGGYTATWQRPPLATGSRNTTLTATSSPVISGTSITSPTRLTGLYVEGPDEAVPGTSAIAIRLSDGSGLVLEDSLVQAGAGAIGVAGTTPTTVPANGIGGGAGSAGRCGGLTSAYGFVCPQTYWTNGSLGDPTPSACGDGCGTGGQGASYVLGADFAGLSGTSFVSPGSCAAASAPGSGAGGTTTPYGGNPGEPGATGASGTPGVAGTLGTFTDDGFVTATGGPGTAGGTGGGGGGGASGPGITCNDPEENLQAMGGSGGDGGSGGCGGDGGGGGGGGGASVALYLVRSRPVLIRVGLLGGVGGTGGSGAPGRLGGTGGPGGDSPDTLQSRCPVEYGGAGGATGGDGGRGGDGGQGGTGGGGAGGHAVLVVYGSDASLGEGSTGLYTELGEPGAAGQGGTTGPVGITCAGYRIADGQCLTNLP